MLWACFVLFTARWIWVAGLGDYGWNYETGMRVLRGQWPYRDFISTLPPLTIYTIVPFLKLAQGSLWAWAVHVHLWWLASLWVGWRLLVALKVGRELQTAAIFLAACLSFPAASHMHAYNYAATTFFGLTAIFLNRREFLEWRAPLAAGLCTGLCVLAKQNVGCAVFLMGCLTLAVLTRTPSKALRAFAPFLLGFVLSLGVPLLIFFYHAGAREVMTQMFLDAGQAKGGPLGMLTKMLPILYFEPTIPRRHFWAIFASGSVVLFFVAWSGWFLWKRQKTQDHLVAGKNLVTASSVARVWLAFGFVALLAICSIPNVPVVKQALNTVTPSWHASCFAILMYVLYCATTSFCVIAALRALADKDGYVLVICGWELALVCSFALSQVVYLTFAAPFAVPLAFCLFSHFGLRAHILRWSPPLACVGLVLFTGLAGPYYPPSFQRLVKLPNKTPFAGLYAAEWYEHYNRAVLDNVSPLIRGKRTLWLCFGGPHLAFGGEPVRDVPLLFQDTYNPRVEGLFIESWTKQPPDFIVYRPFPHAPGSTQFTKQSLDRWLAQNFETVWSDPTIGTSLWKPRSTNAVSSVH